MEDVMVRLMQLSHDREVREIEELERQMRIVEAGMEELRKRFPNEVEKAERELA